MRKNHRFSFKRLNSNSGFTIIEVLIVLAIAGLILFIVFLAVPALQRNSRNVQRKEDAGRLADAVHQYMDDHPDLSMNTPGPAGLLGAGIDMVDANHNGGKLSLYDNHCDPASTVGSTPLTNRSFYCDTNTPLNTGVYVFLETDLHGGSDGHGNGYLGPYTYNGATPGYTPDSIHIMIGAVCRDYDASVYGTGPVGPNYSYFTEKDLSNDVAVGYALETGGTYPTAKCVNL